MKSSPRLQPGDRDSIADKKHRNPPSVGPTRIELLFRPFQRLRHDDAAGGVLLLMATFLAMAWANSPWAGSYFGLWDYKVSVGIEEFVFSHSIHQWINDGLMAVFFFVVGLEIKREFMLGELASARKALLPIAGAIGGMALPAGVYLALNWGTAGSRGWGIPMATDIAFSVAILTLLGHRVPVGLKVYLAALAIVDDIGAVIVIALFYTGEISIPALSVGVAFLIGMIALNLLGGRHPLPYAMLGLGMWIAFLRSGIHPTVAGVLAAMTVPAGTRLDAPAFLSDSRKVLDVFESEDDADILRSGKRQAAVATLEAACEHVQTPMQRLEHGLKPWVRILIMPLFALANAGLRLDGEFVSGFADRIALGVIAGLVIGKSIGITCFSWLAVKLNLAELPAKVEWRQILGVGFLGGIGFTMSLFIAGLAFGSGPQNTVAKSGIVTGSLIAGLVGCGMLTWSNRQRSP